MRSVLLLVHRLPFPPDKGDKIRSFHLLRELVKHFRVFLGTFIDDANDLQHISQVEAMCTELHCIQISKAGCFFRSALGLVQGRSFTSSWYRTRAMKAWVEEISSRYELTAAIAFSSGMAQFLPSRERSPVRIMDFVDLDSAKWDQLARSHRWPASWLYAREANFVSQEEIEIADAVDYSSFVSTEESDLLRERVQDKLSVIAVRNGINCDYFDPSNVFDNPFRPSERALVFTGAMDYWANAEAVTWFVESVMPLIRQHDRNSVFYIVGANPTSGVRKLAREADVIVTGRVPDVRPYLRWASVIVAPLKLARGVQNKVLEAMAMARPLVVTSAAIEGIGDPGDAGLTIADTEAEFATACTKSLWIDDEQSSRPRLRDYVTAHFSWQENLKPLLRLVDSRSVRSA